MNAIKFLLIKKIAAQEFYKVHKDFTLVLASIGIENNNLATIYLVAKLVGALPLLVKI